MKHKLIITISFLILFFNFSYSQNKIDSLTNVLKNCKSDTSKISVLNELAMNLSYTNPILCLEYANLSNTISQKENYKIHHTETLNALAAANWVTGNYDKSLEYLFEKLEIFQKEKDKKKIAKTYRHIAVIYNETGRYELSLNNLFKALEINKNNSYEKGIIEVCNSIGITYNRLDSLALAKKYWLIALKYQKYNKTLQAAYIKTNLGDFHKKNNQFDSALIYYNESLEICQKYKDYWGICSILQHIGEIYMEKNKIKLAKDYYDKALDLAKEHKFKILEKDILLSDCQLDTIKKDFKSAFENYTRYISLKDSVFSKEQDKTISELQIKYETEKKEQENKLLKNSERIKSLIATTTSTILILTIILLIFLWRLIRIKQKTNTALNKKNNEIIIQNTIINEQKEELRVQSEELFAHKNHLEEIVKERTIELFSAKEKAEESDQLKTAFLNNISHEFRTPMNGIIGFSSFLTKENLPTEEREKYANIINKSCNQLINIVSDTIDISKIHSNQTIMNFSNVNVEQILTKTLKFVEFEINQKNLQIVKSANCSIDKAEIVTDKAMLKKIIFHLTDNAVKFTHKGKIKFNYTITDKDFKFSIEDTGIGIPEEMQQIIFDPFRQIETGATRNFGGNGLGLSIVKKYIEKLNGKIELISEINKGTTVIFTIPLKQRKSIKKNTILQKKRKISEQTIILIAEDNEMNFLLLNEAFSKYKCKILHGRTGLETIELFKLNPQTDIILMDLKMPIMNGLETTKQIRESNNKIPIIAQTAYSENQKSLKSKGFNDLIIKPIKITELINKIEQLL